VAIGNADSDFQSALESTGASIPQSHDSILPLPSFFLPPLVLFFPPLPFPSLPFPSLPLKVGPSNPVIGFGEHCELSHRGLGWSPIQNRIWCILALKYAASDCRWVNADMALPVDGRPHHTAAVHYSVLVNDRDQEF